MKKKTKKADKGSLTAKEYEEIYYFLNEYTRLIKLDRIEEPFYVKDVRLCNLENLQKIAKKMRYRMEVKFPNSFVV